MMAQWQACKDEAKEAVLLFRMGDFYEAFYDDATLIAKKLGLTLTKRQEVPMSGVPFHTAEAYIDKLVEMGHKVAIAEQMEDPKKTKGLVRREIVRIITPGTVVNSSLLQEKNNNFFAAIAQVGSIYGLAFIDITTAECKVTEFAEEKNLYNELLRLRPAEILVSRKFKEKKASFFQNILDAHTMLVNTWDDWRFDHQVTYPFLIQHLKVHSLDGFGLQGKVGGINAAGALLRYIQENLSLSIDHVKEMGVYFSSDFMSLDFGTERNLEITESLQERGKSRTLLSILDKTVTPMGGRLMRQFVKRPLLSVDKIKTRQEAVKCFFLKPHESSEIERLLDQVQDLERIMMKIETAFAGPKDIAALRFSLEPLEELKKALSPFESTLLEQLRAAIRPLPELTLLIQQAIEDSPPLRASDGNVIREGYCGELDDLRCMSKTGKSWIANYQAKVRDETGIKTLKVGYNKMFGYFIEVSRGQCDKVPDSFQRRQTLVNAERFITPALKEYETKILTAEERMLALEAEIFAKVRQEVAKYAPDVLSIAKAIAYIDCLLSLGLVARKNGYVRPEIDKSKKLHIVEGRHPVVEEINLREKFVPNDTLLDQDENQLMLITGPNMAGKSTYIRQVALIAIMAQMGSFVPAKEAHIGIIDQVFTRIGASDDLAKGQSTFMVEMAETANILHNATDRSLVILDEIGRGTSTYDGISIAWAVAEYLLTEECKRAKTLFATHYFELTKLEGKVPGAINYNVCVQEVESEIHFLRKIVRGSADKSYGIHVAKLAGLPLVALQRASEILDHLEENRSRQTAFEPSIAKKRERRRGVLQSQDQLLLFD